jgi:hypothetical protein
MQPTRARVTIELELDSEPIEGSLSGGDGDRHAFRGWIELVSLLQDAATTAPPPDQRAMPVATAAQDVG